MNYPILFESTATSWDSLGIGVLSDAVSCIVTEERNGEFELEMKYPITGAHYSSIAMRSIIVCKPSPVGDPQPFRVYKISKPISGVVTIAARHISYDQSGIPVSPFTGSTLQEALDGLASHSVVDCPFTFTTTKSIDSPFTVDVPSSMRSWLGGKTGSIIDLYGGEWEFNKYSCKLYNRRGSNRGVVIRYGKNLTDLKQEENCAAVYTGVYPYWKDYNGNMVQLPEKIVAADGSYDYTKIYPLDLSEKWNSAPDEEKLRTAAVNYIAANSIGIPKVSLDLSFVDLDGLTEEVDLCDTVTVEFPKLGVSTSAECIKTEYNVLLGRYDSVKLGDAKGNIADTVTSISETVKSKTSVSYLETVASTVSKLITGNLGGYVVFHDADGNGEPDEILIMDTDDITTAKKVWRWNKSGLGYSSNGYAGSYGLAITADGHIVADFVNTGALNANIITDGVLRSSNGRFELNLDTGVLTIGGGLVTDNGTTAMITTKRGYTFSDDGLIIDRDGSVTKTVEDETGIKVLDKTGSANARLFYAGVENSIAHVDTQNLNVLKYLCIGANSRFEDYQTNRTGCFYVGE